MAAASDPTVTELSERLDWHENRLRKVEDRVDRLYAQSRVFLLVLSWEPKSQGFFDLCPKF